MSKTGEVFLKMGKRRQSARRDKGSSQVAVAVANGARDTAPTVLGQKEAGHSAQGKGKNARKRCRAPATDPSQLTRSHNQLQFQELVELFKSAKESVEVPVYINNPKDYQGQ